MPRNFIVCRCRAEEIDRSRLALLFKICVQCLHFPKTFVDIFPVSWFKHTTASNQWLLLCAVQVCEVGAVLCCVVLCCVVLCVCVCVCMCANCVCVSLYV